SDHGKGECDGRGGGQNETRGLAHDNLLGPKTGSSTRSRQSAATPQCGWTIDGQRGIVARPLVRAETNRQRFIAMHHEAPNNGVHPPSPQRSASWPHPPPLAARFSIKLPASRPG